MTVAFELPWLMVIGRVFGRLDLRNVDRALPTCVYISRKMRCPSLFTYNHVSQGVNADYILFFPTCTVL